MWRACIPQEAFSLDEGNHAECKQALDPDKIQESVAVWRIILGNACRVPCGVERARQRGCLAPRGARLRPLMGEGGKQLDRVSLRQANASTGPGPVAHDGQLVPPPVRDGLRDAVEEGAAALRRRLWGVRVERDDEQPSTCKGVKSPVQPRQQQAAPSLVGALLARANPPRVAVGGAHGAARGAVLGCRPRRALTRRGGRLFAADLFAADLAAVAATAACRDFCSHSPVLFPVGIGCPPMISQSLPE
eukprot:gene17289-biopygen6785